MLSYVRNCVSKIIYGKSDVVCSGAKMRRALKLLRCPL